MGAETQPPAVQGPVATSPRAALGSRAAGALLTLVLVAAVVERVPALARYRLLSPPEADSRAPVTLPPPTPSEGEAQITMETRDRPELAQVAPREAASPAPGAPIEKPPLEIADPGDRGLAGFYRALLRTERKEPGAVTRIVHFGDSIVTSDYVSGTLRRRLQDRFGDAGHGFLLMANAWPAYFHNDVSRYASTGWSVSRIVGPMTPDGLYGLGGVTFRAPPGSRARFGTSKAGRFGRSVSSFELEYLEQPGGGKLRVNLDGREREVVDTAGPAVRVARKRYEVADGEHELEVVTIAGTSRAFGVVMERAVPGVVLDAIGIQGARVRFLDQQDDAHWAEQLQWRDPALLVYQFGANESGDGFAYPMVDYQRTLQVVLRQGLAAVPRSGCLVVGAMDRAEKRGEALSTMAVIPALVAEQKKAAAEVGCAFFDTFTAMGGSGSMAAWVGRGLGQADLTHPTGSGSDVLASWLERALLTGYEAWKRRQ